MARRLRSVAVAAMLRRADPPGVPPAAAADRLAKTHGVCPYCERHHRPGRVSELARGCLAEEARRLRVAMAHACVMLLHEQPSAEVVFNMLSDAGRFAALVEELLEVLRCQGKE